MHSKTLIFILLFGSFFVVNCDELSFDDDNNNSKSPSTLKKAREITSLSVSAPMTPEATSFLSSFTSSLLSPSSSSSKSSTSSSSSSIPSVIESGFEPLITTSTGSSGPSLSSSSSSESSDLSSFLSTSLIPQSNTLLSPRWTQSSRQESSQTPWSPIITSSPSSSSSRSDNIHHGPLSVISFDHPDDVNYESNDHYSSSPAMEYSSSRNHFASRSNSNNHHHHHHTSSIFENINDYMKNDGHSSINIGDNGVGVRANNFVIDENGHIEPIVSFRSSKESSFVPTKSKMIVESSEPESSYVDQYQEYHHDQRPSPSEYDNGIVDDHGHGDNGHGNEYESYPEPPPQYHETSDSGYHGPPEPYPEHQNYGPPPEPYPEHQDYGPPPPPPPEPYPEAHGYGPPPPPPEPYPEHQEYLPPSPEPHPPSQYLDHNNHYDEEYGEILPKVHLKKPATVGDMYGKKSRKSNQQDSMSSQSEYGATITSTEYKTGHYIRPKGSRYPKAFRRHSTKPKTVTKVFTVPQPIPDEDYHKPKKFEMPSIEIPGLDKLLNNGGKMIENSDLVKNSGLKIPTLPGIDFHNIFGNLFGKKGPPAISVAAPESLGNLIAPLLGHGKPPSINMPNIELGGDLFGNNHGDDDDHGGHGHGGGGHHSYHGGGHGDYDDHVGAHSTVIHHSRPHKEKPKTKLVGFSVPDFMKNSKKFISEFDMPKIDFSGQHESGLTLPHFEMKPTRSKGKSPKITAIAPMPSLHILKHINLPLPKVPKMRMPELGPFRNFKMPKLDLTKSIDLKALRHIGNIRLPSKRDSGLSLAAMENSPKPSYLPAPLMFLKSIPTKHKLFRLKKKKKKSKFNKKKRIIMSNINNDNNNEQQPQPQPSQQQMEIVKPMVEPIMQPLMESMMTEDEILSLKKYHKIITAYPLTDEKNRINGHVVVEDYPNGRQQQGPYDDGGEPELDCSQLDKLLQQQQQQGKQKPIKILKQAQQQQEQQADDHQDEDRAQYETKEVKTIVKSGKAKSNDDNGEEVTVQDELKFTSLAELLGLKRS